MIESPWHPYFCIIPRKASDGKWYFLRNVMAKKDIDGTLKFRPVFRGTPKPKRKSNDYEIAIVFTIAVLLIMLALNTFFIINPHIL